MAGGKHVMKYVMGSVYGFALVGASFGAGLWVRPHLDTLRDYLSLSESAEVQGEFVEGDAKTKKGGLGIVVDDFEFRQVNGSFSFEGTKGSVRYRAGAYPVESEVEGDEKVDGQMRIYFGRVND